MMNWTRVTRSNPCVICNHPDWCGVSEDGKYAVCMRIESDHPTRNGGWLHNLSGGNEQKQSDRALRTLPPSQFIDCERLLTNWRQHQNGQLEPFAATLGVSQDALRLLGCVWASEYRAFAFPMRNSGGQVVGIRLRNERGDKWAVKGSKQGLFMNFSGAGFSSKDDGDKRRMAATPAEGTAPKLGSGKCAGPTSASNSRVRCDVTARRDVPVFMSGQLLERPKSVRPPSDQPWKAEFDSPPAQTNLPTVPELAEPIKSLPPIGKSEAGEARESQVHVTDAAAASDSRRRQAILFRDEHGHSFIESQCVECGKIYPARRDDVLNNRAKFCGKECHSSIIRHEPTGVDKETRKLAYDAVGKALKSGLLVKVPCVQCKDVDSEAHHEDYGKPLDVIWLCRSCHTKRHTPRGGRRTLLIVEGPTDTAAAIDLGYDVIGRPACVGCEDMIVRVVKSQPVVDTFIIADADAPGQRGAQSLQTKLRKAKIVTLPCKDLRAFLNAGGTKEILNGILSAQL